MKSLSGTALLASALFALAGTAMAMPDSVPPQSQAGVVQVTQVSELQSQGALLLDVREVAEYTRAHAPGSVLIPLGELGARLSEIQAFTHRPIAIICRSGNRSGKAVKLLQRAGFSAAANVAGGMLAWEKAGLMMVKGPPTK